MNKLVYLGLSILDLTKTVMFGFWYNYVKPKHGESAKLCYVYVKTGDIYKDIAEDVEKRFDTYHYLYLQKKMKK